MTDKLAEFRRINEPRVQRALDQIGHIEKSAASMKVHELDVQKIMQPIRDTYQRINADVEEFLEEEKSPPRYDSAPVGVTPPVAQEMARLENLSTQQLVDRMIACGAELAKRRK